MSESVVAFSMVDRPVSNYCVTHVFLMGTLHIISVTMKTATTMTLCSTMTPMAILLSYTCVALVNETGWTVNVVVMHSFMHSFVVVVIFVRPIV